MRTEKPSGIAIQSISLVYSGFNARICQIPGAAQSGAIIGPDGSLSRAEENNGSLEVSSIPVERIRVVPEVSDGCPHDSSRAIRPEPRQYPVRRSAERTSSALLRA